MGEMEETLAAVEESWATTEIILGPRTSMNEARYETKSSLLISDKVYYVLRCIGKRQTHDFG